MNDLRDREVRTSRVHFRWLHPRSAALPWVALPLLAVLAALAGCSRTSVDVVLESDLIVPDEVDGLSLRVSRGDVEVEQRYPLDGPPRSLTETITLLPGPRLKDEVQVHATAWLGGEEVAAAEGTARFVEGQHSELRLHLTPHEAPPPEGDAGPAPDAGPPMEDCLDEDGDGYGEGPGCLGPDCDDDDEDVSPGALEDCNDEDDDCDLLVDEGCPCDVGQSQLCGTPVGECSYGAQICRGGAWDDECVGGDLPEEEICDERDNDCDGTSDEGC